MKFLLRLFCVFLCCVILLGSFSVSAYDLSNSRVQFSYYLNNTWNYTENKIDYNIDFSPSDNSWHVGHYASGLDYGCVGTFIDFGSKVFDSNDYSNIKIVFDYSPCYFGDYTIQDYLDAYCIANIKGITSGWGSNVNRIDSSGIVGSIYSYLATPLDGEEDSVYRCELTIIDFKPLNDSTGICFDVLYRPKQAFFHFNVLSVELLSDDGTVIIPPVEDEPTDGNILDWIKNLYRSITSFFPSMFDMMFGQGTLLSSIFESITNLGNIFDNIGENFGVNSIIQWLRDINDRIVSLPSSIGEFLSNPLGVLSDSLNTFKNSISDTLKSAFLPSAEDINNYKDSVDNLLKDRFGFVYESFTMMNEFITKVVTEPKWVDTQIDIPKVSIPLAGTTFTFGGYSFNYQLPSNTGKIEAFHEAVRLIVSFVFTLAFFNTMKRYYYKIFS